MPEVKSRTAQLEQRFQECKVIIGVDRLNYIKSIPQKTHALEVFLAPHPEWIGGEVLLRPSLRIFGQPGARAQLTGLEVL